MPVNTSPKSRPAAPRKPLPTRVLSKRLLAAGLLGSLLLTFLGSCSDSEEDGERVDRLAALVSQTGAAEERSQAFGHELDVLRAVRATLQSVGEAAFIPTPDGILNALSLRAYHQWNSTSEGAQAARALDFENPDHPIHAIVTRAENLREMGVDYLYVLVPSRLEVYPELLLPDLAGAPDFPGINPGTVGFQAELARRGVECVPLLEVFAKQRFDPNGTRWLMRKDTPAWTPAGAALASLTIAHVVKSLPWFGQGPALEGVDFQVDLRTMIPNRSPAVVAAFPEDVLLPIEAVLTRESLAAHVPDRESPIVLLGDTTVGFYAPLGGDLAGQLYRQLGHRLDVISAAQRDDYWMAFERRPDAYSGKQLVIEVQAGGFRLPPTPHAPLPAQ
ncbi:MAG: hypothetical protein ACI8QS_001928 [Planctomycetota bacterium]|jgi:hypothetical protein